MNREELFKIISNNPSWGRGRLLHNGHYCNMGIILRELGVDEYRFKDSISRVSSPSGGYYEEAQAVLAGETGLGAKIFADLALINDECPTFELNAEAVDLYLLRGFDAEEALDVVLGIP